MWLGLAVLVVAVLYPLLWMVFSSFKSNQEVFASPWGLPGELRWGNFGKAGSAGVVRYFVNSVMVTSASILTTVLFSAWAAYGLVRLRVPFGGTILGLLLGGLMLAPTVALIPLFGLLQQLHIYDSYWALIVLYTAFRIPFTTFLIRAYMIDIPSEVDEAATLDGCSPTPGVLAGHPADVSTDPRLGGPAAGALRVERVRVRPGLHQHRRPQDAARWG